MLRKGFTLIELLIVITIIAILAGAAVPYVQDYVEDARYAKAKADLDEIRNALIRYEVDRGTTYTAANIGTLVGPYLSAALVDPWGGAYEIDNLKSRVISGGPDGDTATTGDNVTVDFRPPLALSKAYWEDTNQDGVVSDDTSGTGDTLVLKFTRPVKAAFDLAPADFDFSAGGPTAFIAPTVWDTTLRIAKVQFDTVPAAPFVPGKDTIAVNAVGAGANRLVDGNDVGCKQADNIPMKAR